MAAPSRLAPAEPQQLTAPRLGRLRIEGDVMQQPEILAPVPAGKMAVNFISTGFGHRTQFSVSEGLTIAEMMEESKISPSTRRRAQCWINDPRSGRNIFIRRKHWARVRPKPGMGLTLRVTPGMGGGGKKSTLSIVLSIVIMVAAAAVTWGVGALLAPVIGATYAGIVGGLAGGLIAVTTLPPPRPALERTAQ